MNNEIIQKYKDAALRNSKSLTELCREAGVAGSTITRWRGGMVPMGFTLRKLDAAIAKLEGIEQ
jgi:hypothetical protein